MTYIEVANGVTGYWRVLEYVLRHGRERSPRGRKTVDAGQLTVVFHSTQRALPLGVGRRVSRGIAVAEAVQLIGKFSYPELLVAASPNFKQFMEPDTQRFHGAYGERIGRQLEHVVAKLTADPDTRQAVINLWDPWGDNTPGKRDYPCTVSLVFSIVNDALQLSVFMRSQDVWWGSPYDWFQFSQLQRTVALSLGIAPGRYYHTSVSTHIYAEFINAAREVIHNQPPLPTDREFQPDAIGHPGMAITEISERARSLGYGISIPNMTESERWYADVIASVMG